MDEPGSEEPWRPRTPHWPSPDLSGLRLDDDDDLGPAPGDPAAMESASGAFTSSPWVTPSAGGPWTSPAEPGAWGPGAQPPPHRPGVGPASDAEPRSWRPLAVAGFGALALLLGAVAYVLIAASR